MHFCFTSFDYPAKSSGGGVGYYAQTVARELVRNGHSVSVIALRKNAYPLKDIDQGVHLYFLRPGSIHYYISKIPLIGKLLALPIRELEYSWGVFINMRRLNRKKPIDLSEGIETGNFFIAISRFRKKHIIRLHGDTYTFCKYAEGQKIPASVYLSRLIQRFAMRRVIHMTAPSKVHAKEIKEELGGKKHITVLPNPFNISLQANKFRNISLSRRYLLFVGRLQKEKGIFPLLEAISIVKKSIPDILLKLAGNYHPSISRAEIDILIAKTNIVQNVELLGHVDKLTLNELYENAAGVIIPSYYETFGYVCVEALSFGTPVIAFNIGIAAEIVKDGLNGFLIPVGSQRKLAEACIRLLTQPLSFDEKDIRKQFDPSEIVDRIIEYYSTVLNDIEIPWQRYRIHL